jgi:hypothetical protein
LSDSDIETSVFRPIPFWAWRMRSPSISSTVLDAFDPYEPVYLCSSHYLIALWIRWYRHSRHSVSQQHAVGTTSSCGENKPNRRLKMIS